MVWYDCEHKSVLIISLDGCHDNPQQAPREGVHVCTGAGRESKPERQREGRGCREIPSDTLKSALQPPVPPTHPGGPIHVTMSCLIWASLYAVQQNTSCSQGGCWSWHGRARPTGGGTLTTPHSQDELQGTPSWTGEQGHSWGPRAQGNLPTIMPRLWAWLADVNNGNAFPC